jgi:hypothetical protein
VDAFKKTVLGRTAVPVGRLGVAASYGAPCEAFEEAFEHGCNRALFQDLAEENVYDIFHVCYNAAHRGAESEVFDKLHERQRPAIVSYTATRWAQLLNPKKMPPGESPLTATDCYRFALSHPMVDVCMCGPKNAAQMQAAQGI